MAARDAESGEYSIGMMGVPIRQSLLSSGDGCFIACRRATAQALRWDEKMFDSFHLYDIDFCVRAARSGARIGTARGMVINHLSLGTFDALWREQAARFVKKHGLVSDRVSQAQWVSVPTGTRADTVRVARNLTRLVPDDFQQQLAKLQAIRFALARREAPVLETIQSSTEALAT